MSEEQLKAFLEKLKEDTRLQEKLNAATTPEEAITIAKDVGFSISTEDIQSYGYMTDAELEGAAGGDYCTVEAATVCYTREPGCDTSDYGC